MQAVILAAGMGIRLRPLTDNKPKCMIEVKGEPLLIQSLNKLSNIKDKNGDMVTKVFIVCGYMREAIEREIGTKWKNMSISYIYNHEYKTTNNVYSLYLVRNLITEDFLLLESDLLYTQFMLEQAAKSDNACTVLVSPYNKDRMSGTVIFSDEDDFAISLVVKKHQTKSMDLEKSLKTVNIYKLAQDFWINCFKPFLEVYIHSGNLGNYYELVLGSIIYFREQDIKTLRIDESQWCEIDDLEDYEKAMEGWKE